MNELEFTVIGSPLSQNRVYRRRKGYGMYMTDEGRAFKDKIALIARAARPMKWNCEAWFEVGVVCYFDSQRPDVDGPAKLSLDAMQGILYDNDRQVVKLTMERKIDREYPRMEVRVRELEQV